MGEQKADVDFRAVGSSSLYIVTVAELSDWRSQLWGGGTCKAKQVKYQHSPLQCIDYGIEAVGV
jgi:hypothetical protein